MVGLTLLALLLVLAWLTRRLRGGGPLGSLASRERMVLTAQHTVQVIEIAGVRLLVGTGPSGAPAVLATLGPVEQTASPPKPALARPWAELLGRFGVEGGR
ncbi:flagellar biosynthetic protein FliO [Enhygromyxa salina]|uniref:flagellar biosynthetic protein FliO n=1 Tax=Enhygromyxa salina TaxID=215803 RepID=UPI0011B1E50B|nr:flagellar biosynthetic protein FliO [Enhygromyxa salina]